MAFEFFKGKMIPTKPKVLGPSVSISFRRGQVTFSDDASKMMGLVVDESYVEVGFDHETYQLAFRVSTEAAEHKAKVENFLVKAKKINVPVIYIWSALDLIKGVSKEAACRYPLYAEDGLFYIKFSEGVEKPKAKPKPEKMVTAATVAAETPATMDQQKPPLEAVKAQGKAPKKS
ncbi:MAG: hypothetical protein VB122_08505 [Erysipelotrichales bacterium]|nr:hypothetical protein [Erysipelotrichales bacterium]